jgi:hypothetical protein
MGQTYRLVGSQDPASRIDRWDVESPSEDNPSGKTLFLHGRAEELDDRQYAIGSQFLKLEPVKAEKEVQAQVVDQPGVRVASLSTDKPPDPGTAPEVGSLDKEGLQTELARVQAEGFLQDVDPKSNKEDLAKALRKHHGQGA